MDKLKIILRAFFESVKVSLETFILPTGKYLLPAVAVAFVILIVTIVSNIFGVFTLLSIPGAALGLLVLLGICFIERRERSEISNLYRAAQTRVQAVISRKARPSSSESAEVDGSDSETGTAGDSEQGGDDRPGSDSGVIDGSAPGDTELSGVTTEGQDDRDLD